MATTIDERVVSMAFENSKFETDIAKTMASLQKLDDSLKRVGANQALGDIEKSASKVTLHTPMSAMDKLRQKFSKGTETNAITDIEKAGSKVTLEQPGRAVDKLQGKMDQLSAGSTFSDIEKASNQVELSGLSKALTNVTGQFSVLQGAASVALGNITSQAAMKGAAFGKSFAFGPLKQGFEEYSTNLNSIQTILANTEGQQVSGLDEVNKHLGELNTYSDQTIYNFGEMAKNIGTFTAAGVDMDKSTQSIKGIANLAALSGSNSQQASTAMYQLSQAISSGRVGLQDWNSVVNAGMGGAVFQKALLRTGENMGTIEKGALKIDKATGKATVNGESFRNSIMAKPGQESWLSSEVLVETLKQFTGDMKEADLVAQGFSSDQAKAIIQQAKTAKAAATEVKTLSQAFDVARESIGSGWAKTFQLIFGDFEESKKTFTEFSNTLNGFINDASDARNKILGEWKKLGGRTVLIEGIKQAFSNLMDILGTVKAAFRDVFPPATGKSLFELTKNFSNLMDKLKPSEELIKNLRSIFGGLFAVVHIGYSIVKGIVGVIADLIGVVGGGSGGFLDFAGGVGEFLKSVDKALTQGGLLKGFFETLTNILKAPLSVISAIATAVFGMFSGADPDKAKSMGDALATLGDKVEPLSKVIGKASGVWKSFRSILDDVAKLVSPYLEQIGDAFQNLGHIIADAIKHADFKTVLAALNTTFLGGLFLAIKKALGGGIVDQLGGGLLKNLSKTFEQLTGNLKAMQQNVQASAILKIAGAIALLAGAVFLISTIDPKKLSSSLGAMAVGIGEVVASMALMSKLGGGLTATSMALGMLLIATSLVILGGAMKIFATMSWEDIAKGLVSVAGGLTAIGIGMKLLGPGTLVQGPALILIGIGLNFIATAVKQFASMKWEDLAKGLAGIGVALGLIALAALAMPPTMVVSGLGLIAMATGMTFMVAAIAAMGALDVKTIAKGIIGIALAVTAFSVAILAFPPSLALQAAGLVILSVALSGIATAVGIMGKLSIGTLAKGLIAMGAALVELAVGMYLMVGTAPGALALLGAALAFAVLAPAMALMGSLDWSTILKALATMALTLLTLAVVGALAAVPLAALGAALVLLGVGLLVATLPIYLLAKALQLLGSEGTKGIAVMVAALTAFVAVIPKIIIDFVKGIVGILDALAGVAPKVVIALGIIIDTVLLAVIQAIPKLEVVIGELIGAFVRIINENSANVIAAGITLLLNFLHGIDQNITEVVNTAADIIVKFLDGLKGRASEMVTSGFGVMLAFLDGISKGIPRIVGKVGDMVVKFLTAVTTKIPELTRKGAEMIIAFLNGVSGKIGGIVAAGARLIGNFIVGIGDAIPGLVKQGLHTARKFLNGLADGLSGLADIGFKAVIRFLNGIEQSIRDNANDLFNAGAGIADAIFDAIIEQAGKAGPAMKKVFEKVFGLLPGWVKKILGIKSPSTVFAEIGRLTMKGFQMGVEEYQEPIKKTASGIGGGLINAFKDVFQIRSPSKVLREIGKQVGQGFRDGLDGSKAEIRASFKDLREKINQEMSTLRGNIREEHKKREDLEKQHADKLKEIQDLQKHPKKNADEIKTAIADAKSLEKQIGASDRAIGKYSASLNVLAGTKSKLVGDLQISKDWLVLLSGQLETVTKDLDTANQKLADIQRERADFAKSIQDQFSKTPDFDKEAKDPVADYKQKLKAQIEATKKFYATMMKLREQGLDDATFRKLLEGGIENQDFADQLSRGGERGIEEINALDKELFNVSSKFGTDAATALYKSGEDIAQGIVDGLVARKGEIEKVMDAIAKSIVDAINKALGIKSPSRVLMEVGKFAAEGIAQGLKDNAGTAANAAVKVGDGVVSAMQRTLADISSAVDDNLDVEPTITPVLDLTQVKKDSGALSDLTNVTPITAAASYGQASAISMQQAATAVEAAATAQPVNHVELTQNNYSPESLSNIEIYRQTNNQMAQLKRALNV